MSYSSLYGINKKYMGEELYEYKNSWFFSPVIWGILADKYLPRQNGLIQNVIGFNGNEVWSKINNIMNNSNNTPDRICWEMSNQQIFFTKDKKCIVDNIHNFIKNNNKYDKNEEDNISILEREHILERFNMIANDILSLNENEYPYFVFKNTSCDDNVEYWFRKYNEETDEYVDKSLKDWNKPIVEFVVIEDDKIVKFINNLNYKFLEVE